MITKDKGSRPNYKLSGNTGQGTYVIRNVLNFYELNITYILS